MDSLPPELATHIFQYLPATDIARLEHLNRQNGSIIQRNRNHFKHPNIRVIYSENIHREMVIKVISGDIGSHWENGKMLRKITFQDRGRILNIQGGFDEFPDEGENEQETVLNVYRWIKENIRTLYTKWRRNDVADIPEFVVDGGRSSESRIRRLLLFNVLRKEKCTIGVMRIVNCLSLFEYFTKDHRSFIGQIIIELGNRIEPNRIIENFQNIEDCEIRIEVDGVITLLNKLKRAWRRLKNHCPVSWSAKILFKAQNQNDASFVEILNYVDSSAESDFHVSVIGEDKRGMQTLSIRGIPVLGSSPENSPELPRRQIGFRRMFRRPS